MANGVKILTFDKTGFTIDTNITDPVNWIAKGY